MSNLCVAVDEYYEMFSNHVERDLLSENSVEIKETIFTANIYQLLICTI